MKKNKFLVSFISIIMLFVLNVAALNEEQAVMSNMDILVNGNKVDFCSYMIKGNNYIKLRDVAAALDNTDSKFEVDYQNGIIYITTGKNYTYQGGELTKGQYIYVTANKSSQELMINNQYKPLATYNIFGYNYFRLRDLGLALNFEVDFDAQTSTVIVNTPENQISDAQAVLNIVNTEREKAGVQPLILNDDLCKAAEKRSNELGELFSHTRPNGESCFTVLSEFNITSYNTAGENIAIRYSSPYDVMNAWLNSSGHRANILNANFKQIGIANVDSRWTQLFIG